LLYATFGLCYVAISYSKCKSTCVGCGNIQIIVEEWHCDGISLAWIGHQWQWVQGDFLVDGYNASSVEQRCYWSFKFIVEN
jgi:hypothetical protein